MIVVPLHEATLLPLLKYHKIICPKDEKSEIAIEKFENGKLK